MNEINEFVASLNDKQLNWSDLLIIDYFYYHHMPDYDSGLSFLDRIHKKLGQFHPEWNIANLKNGIRYAQNPTSVYSDVVQYLLSDQRDVVYYGV